MAQTRECQFVKCFIVVVVSLGPRRERISFKKEKGGAATQRAEGKSIRQPLGAFKESLVEKKATSAYVIHLGCSLRRYQQLSRRLIMCCSAEYRCPYVSLPLASLRLSVTSYPVRPPSPKP